MNDSEVKSPPSRWLYPAVIAGGLMACLLIAVVWFGRDANRQPGPYCCMSSLYMVSANEGWAVGSDDVNSKLVTAMLHYKDGKWTKQDTGIGAQVSDVHMTSSTDGWVVGWSLSDTSLNNVVLRYQNGGWAKQADITMSGDDFLTGIYMTSPNEGWAVGGNSLLHYRNSKWTAVDKPDKSRAVHSVYMLSPDEGWAVGRTVLHYTGGKWTQIPASPAVNLTKVVMVSPTEGWAVDSYGGVILHYSGGSWTRAAQVDGALHGLYMVSANEGWAVGDNRADLRTNQEYLSIDPFSPGFPTPVFPEPYHSIIMHYQNGKWQQEDCPSVGLLKSVFMTSAQEGWAISEESILHYKDGKWSEYQ